MNLVPFFNQYLRDTRIPVLKYKFENKSLLFRWDNVVDDFEMPIEIIVEGKHKWIYPSNNWKKIKLKENEIKIDPNYYVLNEKVND